jgi:hypothetical protein
MTAAQNTRLSELIAIEGERNLTAEEHAEISDLCFGRKTDEEFKTALARYTAATAPHETKRPKTLAEEYRDGAAARRLAAERYDALISMHERMYREYAREADAKSTAAATIRREDVNMSATEWNRPFSGVSQCRSKPLCLRLERRFNAGLVRTSTGGL